MRPLRLITLLLAALALTAPVASAATPRASLTDIEDEVMCVTCSVPLNLAQSPQADQERAFIRTLIARGETKDQIKRELVTQYGAEVLALPATSGFSLAAWIVPIALVLAGLAAIVLVLPRWRRARAARQGDEHDDDATEPELSPDEAARLDRDLARYDG